MQHQVKIEGTQIDCPVMFAPGGPKLCLHRSFEREKSMAWTLLIDGHCGVEPKTASLLIHGYNMLNDSMFQNVISYKKENFYREHPVIEYTTLYEKQECKIAATFISPIY